jgi:hypothetical protein
MSQFQNFKLIILNEYELKNHGILSGFIVNYLSK